MTIESERNSLASRIQPALLGAVYGLMIGTAFVLISAFIDIWLNPDLPLGMNWRLASQRWVLVGLGLGLIGALTCFFKETWAGLLAGSVTAGLLALTSALFITSTSTGIKLIVLVFTLVPVAVMTLPVSLILRRLVERHSHALQEKWSLARIVLLAFIAVALGAGAGYFMKMPGQAVTAVRLLHENLQAGEESQKKEVSQLTGIREHAGMSYQLFQQASEASTEGFDVRAEYADGYSIQCVIVVYPGFNPYISSCQLNE
jgi:uncharacterized membrane protein YhaH (DUF805 family)